MGSSVQFLEKYRLQLQNQRKIFQNRIFQKLHCVLGTEYWIFSIKSEDVVGESTCRRTRTKKHSTTTGVSWAAVLDSTWTEVLMKQTKRIIYEMVVGFCGFFPTWICLMDTEPPLFISAQTEQRTIASTVLSGIWFGWRICNCFSIFPQHFYHLLLDRITLTKSSTKVTNVESAFTVTSTYENIEKKISRAL